MTSQDPFSLVRSRDSFTLDEAARIVCNVPPHRVYPRGVQHWTPELRDEYGKVGEALRMLREDAEPLGVEVTPVPASTKYGRPNSFTGEQTEYPQPARTDYGKVGRDALEVWCKSKGLRPSFFETPVPSASSDARPLQTLERGNLHRLIGVLCEAAGIDLRSETKGHAEAKLIGAWASERRVNLSPETIAKSVVAARELIFPKGPISSPVSAGAASNSNRRKTNSNK